MSNRMNVKSCKSWIKKNINHLPTTRMLTCTYIHKRNQKKEKKINPEKGLSLFDDTRIVIQKPMEKTTEIKIETRKPNRELKK